MHDPWTWTEGEIAGERRGTGWRGTKGKNGTTVIAQSIEYIF